VRWPGRSQITHELVETFLVLGFAETGQVGVEGGDVGIFVAEVDLDLAQVFAAFQQVGGVTMAQGVDMSVFFDAAGLEGQAEGALERGAAHGFAGRGCALAGVAFGGEEQCGMAMSFPLLAQEQQCPLGQRDVTVATAFAGADVEEAAIGVDVAHFQAQGFAQAQAAGIDGDQGDAMIQGGHGREDAAHFGGREHDGQFEVGIGADQLQFMRPEPLEGFFPEELEGADDLGGSLAGDLFFGLEVETILAKLLGADQVGGFGEMLADVVDGGVVGFFGARADGEQSQVIGEGI
jgi:hypothetical protein